jgi:hypothetical protein
MAIIKLTNSYYVDTEMVAYAYLGELYGGPCVEIFFKAEHLESFRLCDDAAIAWSNWTSYITCRTKEERHDNG